MTAGVRRDTRAPAAGPLTSAGKHPRPPAPIGIIPVPVRFAGGGGTAEAAGGRGAGRGAGATAPPICKRPRFRCCACPPRAASGGRAPNRGRAVWTSRTLSSQRIGAMRLPRPRACAEGCSGSGGRRWWQPAAGGSEGGSCWRQGGGRGAERVEQRRAAAGTGTGRCGLLAKAAAWESQSELFPPVGCSVPCRVASATVAVATVADHRRHRRERGLAAATRGAAPTARGRRG